MCGSMRVAAGARVALMDGSAVSDLKPLVLEEIALLPEQLWFASTSLCVLLQQMCRGCGLTDEVRIQL